MPDPAAASLDLTFADFRSALSHIFGCELAYGENERIRCICHPDEVGSASVHTGEGVWECHAIEGSGGGLKRAVEVRYGVSAEQARAILRSWGLWEKIRGQRRAPAAAASNGVVADAAPAPLENGETMARVYHKTLLEPANKDALDYLTDRLGWSLASIERFQVGYWAKNSAYTFPVRDESGQVVNISRYYPFRDPDDKLAVKADGFKGHNGNYLWQIGSLAGADKVLVVEGQKDLVTVSQHLPAGYVAVSPMTGAKNFPVYLAHLFAGKEVVVIFDCDAAGRAGADKIVKALAPHAKSVKSVDLGLGEHEDVWDYFHSGGTWKGLQSLINKSNVVAKLREIAPADSGWLTGCLDDKGGVIPRRFGDKFLADYPMASSGGWIYRYDHERGVYVADGAAWAERQLAAILGDLWRSRLHGELLKYITLHASGRPLWDPPPANIINCTNGLLNVETLELLPHTPDHLSPVQIPVKYDPLAKRPHTEAFYAAALQPGDDVVADEVIGYALVTDSTQHRMAMAVGGPAGGKSTYLKLAGAMVGSDNRSTASLHELAEDRFATADLRGKLLNVCADLDSHDLKRTGVLKQLTGGDPIRAQHKGLQSFSYTSHAMMLFSANAYPAMSGPTQAVMRRVKVIPFSHTFDKPDRNIDRKLQSPQELSGNLNAALRGLQRLRENGDFTETDSTAQAKHHYRLETSTIAMFIDDCLKVHATSEKVRTHKADLFQCFTQWSRETKQGMNMTRSTFYKQMRDHWSWLDEKLQDGYPYYCDVSYKGPSYNDLEYPTPRSKNVHRTEELVDEDAIPAQEDDIPF